jgi:hypothetical protein
MPEFTDLSHVNLDMFNMIKNNIPENSASSSCPICPVFIYFQFPSKGIPAQFINMTFDKTNTYAYNVLNYQYSDPDKNPMISISTNGNFTTKNLLTFYPNGFQICQKIYTSTIMSTSTNDDLQMIIECKPVSNANTKLFVHLMLTNDLSKGGTSGGDMNILFNSLKSMDQLNTNTTKFQTDNLKELPTNLNFFKAIFNQLRNDGVNSDQPYMLCFHFQDDNKNTHILLQTPIPVSDPNFALLQEYFKKYGLAQNPLKIYNDTKLVPSQSSSIIKDALLYSIDTLANDQNKAPLTADAYAKKKAQKDVEDKTAPSAKKANSAGDTFVGGREGLKTMNCKVANSSPNLVATLVSDNPTVSMDGYQLVIAMVVFFAIGFGCFMRIRMSMFLFSFESPWIKDITDPSSNYNTERLYEILNTFRDSRWRRRGLLVFYILLIAACFIPFMVPDANTDLKFFMVILGCNILVVALLGHFGVRFFNKTDINNRYSYAYELIKKMNNFQEKSNTEKYNNKYTIKKTNEKYVYKPSTQIDPEIIYDFIHLCTSYFFGDKKWYADEIDKVGKTIHSIKKKDNKIEVNFI